MQRAFKDQGSHFWHMAPPTMAVAAMQKTSSNSFREHWPWKNCNTPWKKDLNPPMVLGRLCETLGGCVSLREVVWVWGRLHESGGGCMSLGEVGWVWEGWVSLGQVVSLVEVGRVKWRLHDSRGGWVSLVEVGWVFFRWVRKGYMIYNFHSLDRQPLLTLNIIIWHKHRQ